MIQSYFSSNIPASLSSSTITAPCSGSQLLNREAVEGRESRSSEDYGPRFTTILAPRIEMVLMKDPFEGSSNKRRTASMAKKKNATCIQ
jgi:hypothetical protein